MSDRPQYDDAIRIHPVDTESKEWKPSQFNAHTIASDGTLLVWNSYSSAFSGFPPALRNEVETALCGELTGLPAPLAEYLQKRGFLVPARADEFERFRLRFGHSHYRRDHLELTLLTSEDCNFRCVYCYEDFARGTMEPWVATALVRMVERRAPHLRTFHPSYFGGEPLLGFDRIAELAPAFLSITDKHNVALTSSMTTNAYLLDGDTFEKLLGWKVTRFQITIDGLPHEHNSRRMLKGGGPTFDRILENLKNIRRFNDDFRVTLRINFDRDTAVRMREFIAIMAEFKSDPRFQMFFYPIRKLGGTNDEQLNVCGDLGPERDALEVLGRELGMRVQRTAVNAYTFGSLCYAARPYHLVVGADGRLMKCTVAMQGNPFNLVGKLNEDGSLALDADRFAAWCAPRFADDPACRRCFFLPACSGGDCPVPRVAHGKRKCPSDKVRIAQALQKLWSANHAAANRFDIRNGVRVGVDDVPPPDEANLTATAAVNAAVTAAEPAGALAGA